MESPREIPRDLAEQIYGYLADDEDARVCLDIPDSACREQPLAFTCQLLAQTLTKIGDALISARLVLAWMLSALGAPAIFISLLVPLRESLSLVPQLFIARIVREHGIRKYFWVWGSVAEGLSLAFMIPAVLWLNGAAAGWAIIGLLVFFSLARGVCSVAAKDVLGKTVSKTRRGRLSGVAASAAGLVTLIVAGAIIIGGAAGFTANTADRAFFAMLLGAATLLWLTGASIFALVPEVSGATEGGGNAFTEAIKSLSLLTTDSALRDFVIARGLLVSTAFAIPYIVVMIQRGGDGAMSNLASLLLADGAAGLVSGRFWGKWADRASNHVMAAATALSVMVMLATLLVNALAANLLGLMPIGAGVLFLAAVSHQGVRVARKTYLVDMASSENRAQYTAVSNTVIGVLLLAGSGLGAVDAWLGTNAVLWLLVALGSIGIWRSLTLVPVSGE